METIVSAGLSAIITAAGMVVAAWIGRKGHPGHNQDSGDTNE
ncbi:hypothetical protein [Streptomyces sp. NPDC054794]